MPKLISVGELIDKSWEQYRTHFVNLVSISGWLLVVAALNIVALVLYPNSTKLFTGAELSGLEQVGVLLFMFSAWVIAPLLGVWVTASLVRLIKQQLGRTKPNVSLAMKEGRTYFLPTLLVSLLVGAVLVGGLFIGMGPGFLLALIASATNASSIIFLANTLLVVGIFAALVLNIRWSVQFVLAPYATLLDDKRGIDALKSTRALIAGRFWQTLVLMVAPKVVFLLFGAVALWLLQYITNILVLAGTGLNVDVQLRLITITSAVYPIILAALINPLIAITDVLLYRSLKEASGKKA